MNNKIEHLKNHRVLKEILNDSMGGILYDVANKNKYDTKNLLSIWDSLDASEKSCVGGIIEGAINFISEEVKKWNN